MSAPAIPAVLPQADLDFLSEKGWQYEIAPHPGEVRIYIRNFPLPEAYSPRATDLLIRLPFGLPAVEPRHVLDEARGAAGQRRLPDPRGLLRPICGQLAALVPARWLAAGDRQPPQQDGLREERAGGGNLMRYSITFARR